MPASLSNSPAPRGQLRILLGADTFAPDVNGAATFCERLAYGLAGRGHQVHVVCPGTTSRSRGSLVDGVRVHRVGAYRTPFHPTFRVCLPWRAEREVAGLLERVEPDVAHAQAHFVVGRALLRRAEATGVPAVATNHFMPENLLGYLPLPDPVARIAVRLAWRDLDRQFSRADVVTAPTPRAVKLMRANGFAGPAEPISCGIDLDRYRNPGDARRDTEPTVLFVGRLDAEKHVHELVAAVAALRDRGTPVRAEIVGEGSCRADLEAMARAEGVAGQVRFLGYLSEFELLAAYARASVFCMPGIAELQSIATMEAMASGLPVVAADAVALPHLVRDGDNGRLYRPGDVAALTDHLADLLVAPDSEALRARMARASGTVIADHAMDATLTAFEELYQGLCSPAVGSSAAVLAGAPTGSAAQSEPGGVTAEAA